MNEFDLVLPTAVDVREVGMRDGLQLEAPVPLDAKLEMLEALVATGVRRIEATSFVSPKAVPALADADQVAAELSRWGGVHWSALVANPRGAVRAVDAGVAEPRVRRLGLRRAQPGQRRPVDGRGGGRGRRRSPRLAHGAGGSLEVIIATAWDCPFDGRTPITRTVDVARAAVTAGADQLCLGDTIGTTTPLRVVQLLDAVRRACPGIPVGVHFHDTRGTGQANALAAIQAGVTQLDSSIGGLGGCPFAPGASGNIATEELVYMLEESGVRTGLDLDAVLAAARVTEQAVGHELPSSLYRAGGRSVPRSRGRPRMSGSPDVPRIVDPQVHARGARPLRLRGHGRHRAHRRRADRVHLPVVQLAVARPAAGRLRPGPDVADLAAAAGDRPVLRERAGRGSGRRLAELRPLRRGQVRRGAAGRRARTARRCWTTSSPGSTASCGPSTTAATTASSWPGCSTSAPIPTAVRCSSTAAAYGLLHRSEA